jgi:hypothetical protein
MSEGRQQAAETLRECGMLAIYDCGTTIDEVMRETMILE